MYISFGELNWRWGDATCGREREREKTTEAHLSTMPGNAWVTRKSRTIPNLQSFRPVHRLESHWPKSHIANRILMPCLSSVGGSFALSLGGNFSLGGFPSLRPLPRAAPRRLRCMSESFAARSPEFISAPATMSKPQQKKGPVLAPGKPTKSAVTEQPPERLIGLRRIIQNPWIVHVGLPGLLTINVRMFSTSSSAI